MQYLATMTDEQTLAMYSGHPMGLFPSHQEAPRVVVTNGMMIPSYSKPDDWEKFNALGVSQYGQMTAGSYMYIGPQGIVHGTTITVLNGFRKIKKSPKGGLFVTSGLGGMSGAQPKAGNIAGCVTVCAEVNPKITHIRHSQGWINEVIENIDELVPRVQKALANQEVVSIAYLGNVVDVWERFDKENILIDLGSDQTSLHNPWAGGYYPIGYTFEESNEMMANEPEKFKVEVKKTLRRHANAINQHTAKGTYFFDYGNAFLLEASRAGADIMAENQKGPIEGSKEYNMLRLKREMDLINPAVLAQTPIKQKFLVFLSKTELPGSDKIMNMIYERKETVKSSIDGIKVALQQNASDLDNQMVDLMTIYKGLLASHKVLKTEIYTAKTLYNKIVDLDISDPVAKENINTVLADLTTQINALMVEENMNAQFFAGSQLTAKLVREQQNQIRILVQQMEKAVLANLGLRIVAKSLEESVNQSKALGDAIANTIADTAKANEKTTDKLIQARVEGYIDLNKLQEGVDALTRTFEKEAKANQLIIEQGLIVSKKLQEATKQLESKIDKEV
jgi:hypothetical protein